MFTVTKNVLAAVCPRAVVGVGQQSNTLTIGPIHATTQVRFRKKTFALQHAHGLRPLYTDHLYKEAVEKGQLEELSYHKIRFPLLWEINSPLSDDILEKFIRYMMTDGRRYLYYELLHKTLYEIKTIQFRKGRKDELNPLELFHKAIDNMKPVVVTKKVRRGGATYQVPYPVEANQSEWQAMKWLNDMVKERPRPRVRHYYEVLAQEIVDGAYGGGKVVKKKDDLHKLALANKAYAHYRWG